MGGMGMRGTGQRWVDKTECRNRRRMETSYTISTGTNHRRTNCHSLTLVSRHTTERNRLTQHPGDDGDRKPAARQGDRKRDTSWLMINYVFASHNSIERK